MHMHGCQHFWLLFLQFLQNYCNLNGAKPIIVYDIGTVTVSPLLPTMRSLGAVFHRLQEGPGGFYLLLSIILTHAKTPNYREGRAASQTTHNYTKRPETQCAELSLKFSKSSAGWHRLMVVSGNCWHPKKERSEFEILKSFKMLRNAIRDLTPLKNFGV